MLRVCSNASMYDGKWLVIREHDWRILHGSGDPRECARWIKTWGDTLGHTKRGSQLSPRFTSMLPFMRRPSG